MSRRFPAAPLLAAALLVAAAACSAAAPGDAGPRAGDRAAVATLAGALPAEEVDGDEGLVADAVDVVSGLEGGFAAASRRHPGLRGRLGPLAALHAQHRRVLVGALPDDPSPAPGGSGPALPPAQQSAAALRLLQRRERQAAGQLTDLAVRADSGRFARLLASMAASTTQVRIALGAAPADGGGAGDGVGGPGTDGARADPGARSAEGATTALQDALAAEHAAVWLLGVLGARTSASGSPGTFLAVGAAYDAHRARRDGLVTQLRALGAEPVPASATYRLPREVTSTGVVRRLGRRVEQTTAGWWSALVSTSVGPLRRDAAAALADAAVRELELGGTAHAFPGAPELEQG